MACNEEEIWQDVQDEEISEELTLFMLDYKEAWEESLSTQSYSMMEEYFIGNSQVFHMERKQHQQLSGERKIERLKETSDVVIEVNQFDEYRVQWNETIEVDQISSVYEETRARRYYISESENVYKIIAIEDLTMK